MDYWAISDLAAHELELFAGEFINNSLKKTGQENNRQLVGSMSASLLYRRQNNNVENCS
jgi:hypothetical protein